MDYLAILPVADAENLIERLVLGELNHRVIELAAANKVRCRALVQSAVRRSDNRGAHEGDVDGGIGLFDGLRERWSPLQPTMEHREDENLPADRPDTSATPDTSKTRFLAWPASANQPRRQISRTMASLETMYSKAWTFLPINGVFGEIACETNSRPNAGRPRTARESRSFMVSSTRIEA